MSSSDPKNWQQRLQELEAELNQPRNPTPQKPPEYTVDSSYSQYDDRPFVSTTISRTQHWLNGLSTPAKMAVLGGTAIGGLLIVGIVMRLVQLAVQLAILAALGYAGYRFLLKPKSPNS